MMMKRMEERSEGRNKLDLLPLYSSGSLTEIRIIIS
jgi:hypothetical protein